MEAAQQSCRDDKLLADLAAAATAVTQALNDLLQHIKKGAGPTAAGESHEDAVDMILTVTDRLFSSVGDAHEMVRQARQLAQRPLHWLGPSGEKPRATLTRTCRSGSWPPPDNSLMLPRTWWTLPRLCVESERLRAAEETKRRFRGSPGCHKYRRQQRPQKETHQEARERCASHRLSHHTAD